MIFPDVLYSHSDSDHEINTDLNNIEAPGDYILVDRNIASIVTILENDILPESVTGYTVTKIDQLDSIALYEVSADIFGGESYAAIAYRVDNITVLDSTYFPLQQSYDVKKLRMSRSDIKHVMKNGKVPLAISSQRQEFTYDYLDNHFSGVIDARVDNGHMVTTFGFTDSADFVEWELAK